MVNLTAEERNYIAGFVDADGSIGLYICRNSDGAKQARPTLTVANTHHGVVRHLCQTTGVGSSMTLRTYPDNPSRKKQWVWQVCKLTELNHLLAEITGCLIVKQRPAQLLLDWTQYRLKRGPTKATDTDIRYSNAIKEATNHRGPGEVSVGEDLADPSVQGTLFDS